VKLVYLADVGFYKRFYRKLADVNYKYEHHGPFSWEIVDSAQELVDDDKLKMIRIPSMYGGESYIYKILGKYKEGNLDGYVLKVLQEVINKFSSYSFSELLSYVYTNQPMKDANQGEYIDFRVLVDANQLSNFAEYVAETGLRILHQEAKESIKLSKEEYAFDLSEERTRQFAELANWQMSIIPESD